MKIHDANKFNHLHYGVATCSGLEEIPEQMRNANFSHAPPSTPLPSSTSLQV